MLLALKGVDRKREATDPPRGCLLGREAHNPVSAAPG